MGRKMCEGSAALLQALSKRHQPHERGRQAAGGGGLQLSFLQHFPTVQGGGAGG
jgi:hypothetical protein